MNTEFDEKLENLTEIYDAIGSAIEGLQRSREHAPQPAVIDESGVYRFRANPIVRHLLDSHPTESMNSLQSVDFEQADYNQFLQLIGYSISGIPHGSDHQIDGAQLSAELLDENAQLKVRVAELDRWLRKCSSAAGYELDDGEFDLSGVDLIVRERVAKLEALVEEWQDASGLQGEPCGDPGDITPAIARTYWEGIEGKLRAEQLDRVERSIAAGACKHEPDQRGKEEP